MRRVIIAVAGLALASAASHGSMTKCHKGSFTVVGGLCDGKKADASMCGSPDMTDAMKEEALKQMGTSIGTMMTKAACDQLMEVVDMTCKTLGGTAKDVCGSPDDFCKTQLAGPPAVLSARTLCRCQRRPCAGHSCPWTPHSAHGRAPG